MRGMIKANLKSNSIGRAWVLMLLCFALVLIPVTKVYGDECPEGGDHDYEVELVQQATNTEDGLRTYTCKKCGYSYDEVIENFGHQWSEWTVTDEPQCQVTGVEERHCTKCDGMEQRSIDSLGHQWGEWVEEGDKEVRTCLRDPSHTQEREIIIVTETEVVLEEEPQEEVIEKPEEEAAAAQEESKQEPKPEEVIELEVIEEVQPELEEETEEDSEDTLVAMINTTGTLTEEIEEAKRPPKRSWTEDWTPANTAVATGGGFVVLGLGALLFTGYISPWLWILAKRRKKREEAQRRMYA